jgi:DNA-directed RNA polymerase specialized sigma24 family protein
MTTWRRFSAVVARYWEQLSEAETAAALGCSISAVKAATRRGLQARRTVLTPDMECTPGPSTEEAGL